MAKQIGVRKAIEEGHLDLHYWAEHVREQMFERFNKQGVWPFSGGPYGEYSGLNQKRKKQGKWWSTGAAAKQLFAKVYNAAGGDTAKIEFFYLNYLDFVQWGVGKGRKLSDVDERSKKAHFNKRFAKWGKPVDLMTEKEKSIRLPGEQSRKSRPSLKMEFRHQALRLETHILLPYFQRLVETNVLWEDMGEFKRGANGAVDLRKMFGQHKGDGAWVEVVKQGK